VTTVYIKGGMITVVSMRPQWMKLCNYLRSVQHNKYQNVPHYYVICVSPV